MLDDILDRRKFIVFSSPGDRCSASSRHRTGRTRLDSCARSSSKLRRHRES